MEYCVGWRLFEERETLRVDIRRQVQRSFGWVSTLRTS